MSWVVVAPRADGGAVLHELAVDPDPAAGGVPGPRCEPVSSTEVAEADLAAAIAVREVDHPRWVVDEVALRYPPLIEAGVRLERCHDLRLCHAILRASAACATSALAAAPAGPWDARHVPRNEDPGEPADADPQPTLFDDLDRDPVGPRARVAAPPATDSALDVVDELRVQLDAVAGSAQPGRLRLLLAAESTGALIAAEMAHDGMPWDVAEHDRVLTELLGPRPAPGARPAALEALAARVRSALDAPGLNPDSQPDLLQALRRAGLDVTSTRRYELETQRHRVVEPLLAYKKLSRLLSANGWVWMDTWVHGGRFRPDYVVGGVVTGRWATSGGGALQLPSQIRSAVRATPGRTLVVADAAQLEPRVLAAMSSDGAMAAAARGADLYQGLVDAGVVATRKEAKVGMLGAIYGGTTGVSAAVMPRLAAAFPARDRARRGRGARGRAR